MPCVSTTKSVSPEPQYCAIGPVVSREYTVLPVVVSITYNVSPETMCFTSDMFNYYNYPAFSPSSEWVQTNFKKGMSGFEFFNFNEKGNKTHHPYKFKWVRK